MAKAVGEIAIGNYSEKTVLKVAVVRMVQAPGRYPSWKVKLTTDSTTTLDGLFATAQLHDLQGQMARFDYADEQGQGQVFQGRFNYEHLDVTEGLFELFLTS